MFWAPRCSLAYLISYVCRAILIRDSQNHVWFHSFHISNKHSKLSLVSFFCAIAYILRDFLRLLCSLAFAYLGRQTSAGGGSIFVILFYILYSSSTSITRRRTIVLLITILTLLVVNWWYILKELLPVRNEDTKGLCFVGSVVLKCAD